jgi:hypothetical protein
MVHLSPIFLAPYFRHWCPEFDKNKGTSPRGMCVPGYLSCTVFCAVLSTLYAVAVDMSDPWDGVGADDLRFTLDTEIEEATRAQHHALNEHTGEVEFPWTTHAAPPEARRPLQLRRLSSTVGDAARRMGSNFGGGGAGRTAGAAGGGAGEHSPGAAAPAGRGGDEHETLLA